MSKSPKFDNRPILTVIQTVHLHEHDHWVKEKTVQPNLPSKNSKSEKMSEYLNRSSQMSKYLIYIFVIDENYIRYILVFIYTYHIQKDEAPELF